MRKKSAAVHRRGLRLTTVTVRLVLSCDRDEHVATVRNVLLSEGDDISAAPVITMGRRGESTVEGIFGERREECSLLTVS